jgi:hypothetical protein
MCAMCIIHLAMLHTPPTGDLVQTVSDAVRSHIIHTYLRGMWEVNSTVSYTRGTSVGVLAIQSQE